MNISLSIDSFPVSEQLSESMVQLLGEKETGFSELLLPTAWKAPDTIGFAVIAQTDAGVIAGVASAMDISGLGAYEWSVFVHPDFRRLGLGSALAEGVRHGLEQRKAEEALGVSQDDEVSAAFFRSLGLAPEFSEAVYGAGPSEHFAWPAGFEWTEAEEGLWELRKEDKLEGTLFIEEEEGDLWLSGIEAETDEALVLMLEWSRSEAASRGKGRVLADADPEEEDTKALERAGFTPVSSLLYWAEA